MARGILLNPRCFSHNSTPNFYIRPVVPDPNKNENREKKEGKDVANIETRRTQKRFFPMSVLLPSVSHPCHKSYYKLFARFPLRPACCLAPSQRSSPQAISTVLYPPANYLYKILEHVLQINCFFITHFACLGNWYSYSIECWFSASDSIESIFLGFGPNPIEMVVLIL